MIQDLSKATNQVIFEDWIGDPYDVLTGIDQETLSHKVLGYLDDTTWLAENLDNLQENLKIAHQFYELANIHVNKDKTLILANKHAKKIIDRDSPSPSSYIEIEFGTVIKVPLLGKNKAARILGVYFNPDDGHQISIIMLLTTSLC
ncbi:unnamed protein product [Rhizophagus irregularis]|nr:unnamed protein product [Rhizophagus irregularis]